VEPALEAMVPKIREEILQNMKKDGTFNVTDKDYNDKQARAALNLKYQDILTKRMHKAVSISSMFCAASIVDSIFAVGWSP
jgi:hypothetical protein